MHSSSSKSHVQQLHVGMSPKKLVKSNFFERFEPNFMVLSNPWVAHIYNCNTNIKRGERNIYEYQKPSRCNGYVSGILLKPCRENQI